MPKAASGAAQHAGGSKSKKKWSKGKTKEKLNNAVVFDEETYEKLFKDIPKMKVITTSTVSDRLKINGSLARVAIRLLLEKGSIRLVSKHSNMLICTRATGSD